jgi:secondary thiamine-phosphate synthase enzyme
MHTSASITINENADPSVRVDMETSINRIVPDGPLYTHDYEGEDDMPAHVKSSLMGSSLTIPISNGRLAFGYSKKLYRTWQGIWLGEHRSDGGNRKLIITINGEEKV